MGFASWSHRVDWVLPGYYGSGTARIPQGFTGRDVHSGSPPVAAVPSRSPLNATIPYPHPYPLPLSGSSLHTCPAMIVVIIRHKSRPVPV
jgi:hypothetical protein